MFTGIIEAMGEIKEISTQGGNKTFWIQSPLSSGFRVDQSVAHNGACLTVEEVRDNWHRVTAIHETLEKTTLGQWRPGDHINLERSLQAGARLDGHFVQGHVDAVAVLAELIDMSGSWELKFEFPKEFTDLVIEKGSISLNGISLTIFKVKKSSFKVAVIPYTWEHTNLSSLKEGDAVNLEFDMIGKYIQRSKR